jgi:hypothetical protein
MQRVKTGTEVTDDVYRAGNMPSLIDVQPCACGLVDVDVWLQKVWHLFLLAERLSQDQ